MKIKATMKLTWFQYNPISKGCVQAGCSATLQISEDSTGNLVDSTHVNFQPSPQLKSLIEKEIKKAVKNKELNS